MFENEKQLSDKLMADIAHEIPDLAELIGKEISLFQKIKNLLVKPQEVTSHGVFKALGDGKWLAAYTNDFEDKELEIIERAGHDRFIKRLKAGLVPMPELWLWHTKGTRIGEAVDIDRYGHIVVAIGQFDATDHAREAERNMLKDGTKDIRLSHGFTYPLWAFKNGVYSDLNTFEITLLPQGKEANPYTAFEIVVKENTMAITDEKRSFFSRFFGEKAPDVIGQIEGMEERAKAVEAMGTRYKDTADLTPAQPAAEIPAPAQTPDESKLLSEMILDFVTEVQNMYGLMKSMDTQHQADKAADKAQIAALTAQVKAATDALNAQTKALQSEAQLAPRSVQRDGGKEVDPKSNEGQKAIEELDGQKGDGSEAALYAKMFGGLNKAEEGSVAR